MIKYPNLLAAAPYFNLSYFAEITNELLIEVIKGNEELTATEATNICKYTHLPYKVLYNTKLITIDKKSRKHRAMMEELQKNLYTIYEWQKKGSHEADIYMKYQRAHYVNMELNFSDKGEVPYCQYLGIKHEMENALSFIKGEQHKKNKKPRGVTKQAG